MKDNKTIKLKTNKFVLKNLIVIVVLAFAALAGVWSWMTNRTTATATGISLACEVPDGVEYQIVEHGGAPKSDKWIKGSMILSAENYDFLQNLSFCEVTGDGSLGINDNEDPANSINLFRPTLTQSGSSVSVDRNHEMTRANMNENYLSFDLYVRSKSESNIFLSEQTTIYPDSLDLSDNLNENGYSKDAVVGAVRCKVNNSNDDFIWIPAPHLFYDEESNPASPYLFTNITNRTHKSYIHTYDFWDGHNVVEKSIKIEDDLIANSNLNYTLGASKNLMTLTQQQGDEYKTAKANFTIWFEGEDAEARGAFVGGKFKIKLVLKTAAD